MKSFWSALSFLTVLPVPRSAHEADFTRALGWFPAVGWLLGALLMGAALLLGGLPPGLRGGLLLALGLGLSGMLHFDGLLDAADALLAPVSVERRLRIMKDVHTGSFALGVGVAHLILKWQALTLIEQPLDLLAIPALARLLVLWPMKVMPVARSVEGARPSLSRSFAAGPGAGVVLPLLLGLPALWLAPLPALAMVVGIALLSLWAAGRLGGGLTGDIYGALVEMAELIGLIAVVAAQG